MVIYFLLKFPYLQFVCLFTVYLQTLSVPQILTSNDKTVSEYCTAEYLQRTVMVECKKNIRLSQIALSIASICEKVGVAVMF